MDDFINKFPTYSGTRPPRQGRFVNVEKQQIEDWTHRSLKSDEPNPLFISFEALGGSPAINYERWLRSLTDDSGGGELR